MPEPGGQAGRRVRDVLGAARTRLAEAGIETASVDARVLLEFALARPQVWLHANPEALIAAADLDRFEGLLARREQRQPVSQIVGRREFWSLSFDVTRDVLTPRPDSETLIEAVLEQLPDRTAPIRILDLGTGTGCLLLTLLSEYGSATGVGIDVSPAALQVAARNGQKLGLDARVDWMLGQWDTQLDANFDVVISNPTYIESGALAALDRDVVDYEPHLALDGGADGLDAYREILTHMANVLAANGLLAFEIGEGQADAITALASGAGLNLRAARQDLSNILRVLVFDRPTKA
jgi:release factor glutamine methyltransferase